MKRRNWENSLTETAVRIWGTWNSVQKSDSNIDDLMMFGIDWLFLLKFVQLTAKKGKRRAC